MDKPCRILFLGNNALALRVLTWLTKQEEEIAGMVLHPRATQRLGEELVRASKLPGEKIRLAPDLPTRAGIKWLKNLSSDLGVSVNFGYILSQEILEALGIGAINLHTGFLPHNRGSSPNVWSIVDGTPSGVTLHFMDEGIDTGDIIDQVSVPSDFPDTGESLYKKLQIAAFDLFVKNWKLIRSGHAPRRPQPRDGSFHRDLDLKKIDEVSPDVQYKAIDLLNRLRARTFPPYSGCWIKVNGRKYYLRLEVIPESALENKGRGDIPVASAASVVPGKRSSGEH